MFAKAAQYQGKQIQTAIIGVEFVWQGAGLKSDFETVEIILKHRITSTAFRRVNST